MSLPSGSTALVTGGRGRLGGLVVSALRSAGIRTLSLSQSAAGGGPDEISADLGDPDAVAASVGDAPLDIVVHLAARVGGDDLADHNRRMDTTIAEVVRRHRPTVLVFASTGAVYGDTSRAARTESSPLLGTSPYALSKRESEDALRSVAADLPELSLTILRIFNIAGPDFPDSLVQRLLRASADAPATLIHPDGFVRDYIHQSDVVRVVERAVEAREPGCRVLNVGAGEPVSTRRLVESLAIDDSAWVEAPGTDTFSWADNSSLTREFGVTPRALPTREWDRPHLA